MPSPDPATPASPSSPPNDETTTVAELRQLIADFVAERDWRKYHSPKNISMALAVEAAELMEHFEWMEPTDSRLVVDDAPKLAAIGEEIADVIGYALAISNELGIDVSATMRAKMIKNRQKYPADQNFDDHFRGRVSSDG